MNGLKLMILWGFLAGSLFLVRSEDAIADEALGEEDAEEGEIEGTEPEKFPTENDVYVLGKDNFDEFVQVPGQ